jgi:hypothetical protein
MEVVAVLATGEGEADMGEEVAMAIEAMVVLTIGEEETGEEVIMGEAVVGTGALVVEVHATIAGSTAISHASVRSVRIVVHLRLPSRHTTTR